MFGVQVLAYSLGRRDEDLVRTYLDSLNREVRRSAARAMLYSMLALDDGWRPVVPEALIIELEQDPESPGEEVGQHRER